MGQKNNDIAFDAFFAKLNGKVYTHPEQMRTDFINALNENGLTVKRKTVFTSKKKTSKK
jgi:hypothetical protein